MSSYPRAARRQMGSAARTQMTFIIIYILFLSARAIFNPFVTVFLQEKGFGAERIGLITGANSLVIILAQPFWGVISDKLRSVKGTLVACMVLQAAFSLALVYCNTFLLLAACFCAYGFFSSPEGPMLDTWCLKSMQEVGKDNAVGQMKFLGCFGYAACSIVSGTVINDYSTEKILPVFAAVLFGIALILLFVRTGSTGASSSKAPPLRLGRMLKDKRFLVFLVFLLFMQLPHRAAYTFYPLLISGLGGDKMMVGTTSAVMFLSEGICLFFSRKLLNRYAPEKVILISGGFFILWQLLYSMASQPWHVALFALLDGPSYAIFTIGVLYYLNRFAPEELRTTYQTVAYAVYFGLSGILGNSLGGVMIQEWGFRTMYLLGAGLIAASISFFIFSEKKWGKKETMG